MNNRSGQFEKFAVAGQNDNLTNSSHSKGQVTVPKHINFRKCSDRPLTPTPFPSEWSLSLGIMCMYFILLALMPTCIYAAIYGAANFWRLFVRYNKFAIYFPKMRGGLKAVSNFSKNSSVLVPWPWPEPNLIEDCRHQTQPNTNLIQKSSLRKPMTTLQQLLTGNLTIVETPNSLVIDVCTS